MRCFTLSLALLAAGCGYGGYYAPAQPAYVSAADAWACEAQAQQAAAASAGAGMVTSIIYEQQTRNACLQAAQARGIATAPAQPTEAEMRANWCAALRRSGQAAQSGECR